MAIPACKSRFDRHQVKMPICQHVAKVIFKVAVSSRPIAKTQFLHDSLFKANPIIVVFL
jgi:hypothetical protein